MPESEEEPSKSREELLGRSISLEHDYVHEVYRTIAKDLSDAPDPFQCIVEDFLKDLEPGSLVADVGCGDGRHLSIASSFTFAVGTDQCPEQTFLSGEPRVPQVIRADNLRLPYKNEAFDAVTSVSVLHHFATRERRVRALRELARVLRIGGKLLIVVQSDSHRLGCEFQDVLIPWFGNAENKKHKETEEKSHAPYKECDEDEDDDDDDDDGSIVSSDDEDALITEFSSREWELATLRRQKFSHQIKRDVETIGEASDCDTPMNTSVDSCYAFVRNAFRRFSGQSLEKALKDNVEVYGASINTDIPRSLPLNQPSNQPTAALANKIEEKLKSNIIELRSLDGDLEEVFGQPSQPLYLNQPATSNSFELPPDSANNERKLVRSVSDFFKKIPFLWSAARSKSSSSDFRNPTSNESSSSKCGIVRSKTTATCTLKFESYPRLERVEESTCNDFEEEEIAFVQSSAVDERLLELQSDIINGNIVNSRNSHCMLEARNSPVEITTKSRNVDFANISNDSCECINPLFEDFYGESNEEHIEVDSSNSDLPKIVLSSTSSLQRNDSTKKESAWKVSKRSINESIEEIEPYLSTLEIEGCSGSPQKRRKFCNSNWKIASSKTLSPFHGNYSKDEDDQVISSYYSMPELSKLTDYYEKYVSPRKASPELYKIPLTNIAALKQTFLEEGNSFDTCLSTRIVAQQLQTDYCNFKSCDSISHVDENPSYCNLNYEYLSCEIPVKPDNRRSNVGYVSDETGEFEKKEENNIVVHDFLLKHDFPVDTFDDLESSNDSDHFFHAGNGTICFDCKTNSDTSIAQDSDRLFHSTNGTNCHDFKKDEERMLSPCEMKVEQLERNIELLKSAISSASSSPFRQSNRNFDVNYTTDNVNFNTRMKLPSTKLGVYTPRTSALISYQRDALLTKHSTQVEDLDEKLKSVTESLNKLIRSRETQCCKYDSHGIGILPLEGYTDNEQVYDRDNDCGGKVSTQTQRRSFGCSKENEVVEIPQRPYSFPSTCLTLETSNFPELQLGTSDAVCSENELLELKTHDSDECSLHRTHNSGRQELFLPNTEQTPEEIDNLHGFINCQNSSASMHRYYHLFRKQELEELIEQYVDDLLVLSSSQHESSWCIIAEKVHVWTI